MNKDYPIKNIYFCNKWVSILCQQDNGPCPLLAIANCMLLTNRIALPPDVPSITPRYLLNLLGASLLESYPLHSDESIRVQQQDQIHTTINLLPKLLEGMDVNVFFSRVDKFEFTEELNAFDAFSISLFHGWILDPQDTSTSAVIQDLAYNQLLTKLVHLKHGQDVSQEGKVIETFLCQTASQLTFAGLVALHEHVKNNQISVFFRNNHFSTMIKRDDKLYLLVTDVGYTYEPSVVWELLDDIAGNTEYTDGGFMLNARPPARSPTRSAAPQLSGTYCRPPVPPASPPPLVAGVGIPIFAAEPGGNSVSSLWEGSAEVVGDFREESKQMEGMQRVVDHVVVAETSDLAVVDNLICFGEENESEISMKIADDKRTVQMEIYDEDPADCAVPTVADGVGSNEEGDKDFELARRMQEEMDTEYRRQQQEAEQRDLQAAQHFQRIQDAQAPPLLESAGVGFDPQVVSEQEEILRSIRRGHERNTESGKKDKCSIS